MDRNAPSDGADSCHDAGAWRLAIVLIVGDEQPHFEKARAVVAQARDAFASGQLPLLVLSRDLVRPATLAKRVFERLQTLDGGGHAGS